jgi:hypothetical protein
MPIKHFRDQPLSISIFYQIILHLPVPEIIDPVFAKTSQNARFLLSENERFGLVFVKTGSINSGTVQFMPIKNARDQPLSTCRSMRLSSSYWGCNSGRAASPATWPSLSSFAFSSIPGKWVRKICHPKLQFFLYTNFVHGHYVVCKIKKYIQVPTVITK